MTRTIARVTFVHVALCAILCACYSYNPRDWQYRPHRDMNRGWEIPEHKSLLVGLSALDQSALPRGFAEYRFEIDCGLCLPEYLIRIRKYPGGHISGSAYLMWFGPDTAESNGITSPDSVVTPEACASPLRSSAFKGRWILAKFTWCPTRIVKDADWAFLLDRLEKLGVLEIPTRGAYVAQTPERCGDPSSQTLNWFILVGSEYRSARFQCLESNLGMVGSESWRVARGAALLLAMIQHTQPTKHVR